MAKFNVDQPDNQAPNFMNYSQERRGNRAWGTLFEGIGEAAVGGVKIADQNIQDNLYKEAEASVEQVRNLFGVDDGTVVGNGSTIPEGSSQLPPGFEQSKDYLSRLSQGYQNGTVTSSYYYGQLQANVKSLKAKYPGYEKQVDDAIQGITGVTPANAIISSLRQEAEAEAQKSTQEVNRQDTFINSHIDSVMATMPDLLENPSKYSFAEIRANVGRYELSATEIRNQQASLALRASRKELTEGEVRQYAANTVTTIAQNQIAGGLNAMGPDIQKKIQDWQKTGHTPNAQELQDIKLQFSQWRLNYRRQANDVLRSPFSPDAPDSAYSWIGKDQKKLDDIISLGERDINDLEEAITNGNYGFIGQAAAFNKASIDTATKNIIEGDKSGIIAGTAALKNLTGDSGVSIYLTKAENTTAITKAILGANVGNVLAGGPRDVNADLSKAAEQVSQSPQVAKDTPNQIVNQHLNGIVNGDNPEFVGKSAKYLFGEGTPESGLNINKVQSNQRASTFARLTTPAVTKSIQKAAADSNDPQIWENYKNWSYQNFVAIARTTQADIQNFSKNVPGLKAYYNPETMKIRVEDTGTGISGPDTGLAAAAQRDQKAMLVEAYRNLNTVMGGLKGITQADGGDKNGALEKILGGMGLQVEGSGSPEERDAPAKPNLLDQERPNRGGVTTDDFSTNPMGRRSDVPGDTSLVRQVQSGARTRKQPITAELEGVLAKAASTVGGVTAEVFSGGQDGKGEGRRRTGSTRHDHGNAADIHLKDPSGRTLSFASLEDRPQVIAFIQEAVRNGATGIGAGPGYMGAGIHIGYGPNGSKDGAVQTWGAGGKSRNAPKWLRDAVAEVTGATTRVASR